MSHELPYRPIEVFVRDRNGNLISGVEIAFAINGVPAGKVYAADGRGRIELSASNKSPVDVTITYKGEQKEAKIGVGVESYEFVLDVAQTDVVILVHGIRDFALWQDAIRATLEAEGLKVEATNYGRFNLVEFLVPIYYFRRKAIEAVWNQIRIVRKNNPRARLSVIAHSFGTYVISQLMKENFDIIFHRIIFCGSVVPFDFEYEQFDNRFEGPILNEVGARDIWPAIAESITWGYGSAGTYGFRRPLVRDRWHSGAKHGYFLEQSFCKKFWVPFLMNGKIIQGAELPESPPGWLQALSVVKLKYMLIVLIGFVGSKYLMRLLNVNFF